MTEATNAVEPRADNMAHRRLGTLTFAAVLMGAAGITLISTAIWAFSLPRGAALAGLLLITLVVTSSLHQERYFLSVAFGVLFVALSDPGGPVRWHHRVR